MANIKACFVKEHKEIEFTAAADLEAGNVVAVGTTGCGVVVRDVKSGGAGLLYLEGVYKMPVSSLTASAGAPLYWDSGHETISTTATSNVFLGTALTAIASTDTVALVNLGDYKPAQVQPTP